MDWMGHTNVFHGEVCSGFSFQPSPHMCLILCLAHPLCSCYALPAEQKTQKVIIPETYKRNPAEDVTRLVLYKLASMEVSPFVRPKNILLAKIRGPLEIFLHFLLAKPLLVNRHFEHLLLSDDHFQLRNKLFLHWLVTVCISKRGGTTGIEHFWLLLREGVSTILAEVTFHQHFGHGVLVTLLPLLPYKVRNIQHGFFLVMGNHSTDLGFRSFT